MQKLLILITTIASLFLSSCASDPVVNRLPWVYRIDIQQGNVITQDTVNQLRPGMTKRQVQFIMGAPMLNDPFHAERWDYYYEYKPGSDGTGEATAAYTSLVFEEERLVHIGGTLIPEAEPSAPPRRQTTVTVPPQDPEDLGVLTRLWRWIGFGESE